MRCDTRAANARAIEQKLRWRALVTHSRYEALYVGLNWLKTLLQSMLLIHGLVARLAMRYDAMGEEREEHVGLADITRSIECRSEYEY